MKRASVHAERHRRDRPDAVAGVKDARYVRLNRVSNRQILDSLRTEPPENVRDSRIIAR